MTELWLKFSDEDGDRRVAVAAGPFSIGRQPGNDLTIADSRLSRTHLKIDRFGDVFVASDCGSSNGSTLNGEPIEKPVTLSDGDRLSLGGVPLEVELIAAAAEPRRERRASRSAESGPTDASSIPTAVFVIAPLIAVLIIVCGGGALYFSGIGKRDVVVNDPKTPRPTPIEDDEPDRTPSPATSQSPTPTPADSDDDRPTPPPVSDEARKIEEHAAKFLRAIALNDPSAFLSTPQVEIVKGRIARFRGSSALASNIRAVRTNSSQFSSLASANGFKPQFLAAAALTKLGDRAGDPAATVKAMMPFLNDLRISLGNSLADDNLLIMADYPRRERNSGRSLQSILEGIPRSKIGDADPREIRTIWFLRKNDKITEEMYDFALRFLAIGTILQNPSDFGVNAEPVSL